MKHSELYIFILFILLAVSAAAGLPDHSQAQVLITPDPDSELWIEGRSNVNRFTCNAERYEGGIELENGNPDQIRTRPGESINLELRIPVRSFECGRSRMNRDMYQALKSDDFLYIRFEFADARTLSEESGEGVYHLEVDGTLTVAGTSREITFAATGYILENRRLRVSGKKKIRMTDYNVNPPTGMLGLIRAEDELIVHFNLFASPDESSNLFGVH